MACENPSQPKRSVPWVAVASLLLAVYIGPYFMFFQRNVTYWRNNPSETYHEKVIARRCPSLFWLRVYTPLAKIEAGVTRGQVALMLPRDSNPSGEYEEFSRLFPW